jgi:dienelactone hydrolase
MLARMTRTSRISRFTVRWLLGACLLALGGVGTAAAKVRGEVVEYRHGETVLEGYLAYDDSRRGKRPGVLVVHDWRGVSEETRRRADQLAALGYVALAADIYGKGVRPTDPAACAAEAAKYKKDRGLMRARARAGLDLLAQHKRVDPRKLGAMGYCFGGTTALELARSGAPVTGTISFHGNLDTPTPSDAKQINGRVLALHGAEDPAVPPAQVEAFGKEMRDAGVDWMLVAYGGAVHAFTNPAAGSDPSKGRAYDARADARSWEQMRTFWSEVFAEENSKTAARK